MQNDYRECVPGAEFPHSWSASIFVRCSRYSFWRSMTYTAISDLKHGQSKIGLSTQIKYVPRFWVAVFLIRHVILNRLMLRILVRNSFISIYDDLNSRVRENISCLKKKYQFSIGNPLYFMVFRFLCISASYKRHSAFRAIRTTRHARRTLPQSRSLFIIRNCPLLTALTDPKYHLRAVSCRLLDI